MKYPNYFRPKATEDLVRLGAAFDGGYVLPARVLANTKGLLSFGLSDDWSFEQEFTMRAGCPVVCFDHTVDSRFWLRRIATNAANAIASGRLSSLGYFRKWLHYRTFFDGRRARHVRRPIGYGVGGSVTFEHALAIAGFTQEIFVKIDIEGWEYRIFDSLADHTLNMTGLAIEMHDVDLHEERIRTFLAGISDRLALVHFHANSEMRNGPDGVSTVVELTFLNRRLIVDGEKLSIKDLPIPGLDAPNSPTGVDASIVFADDDR